MGKKLLSVEPTKKNTDSIVFGKNMILDALDLQKGIFFILLPI